MKHDIHSCVVLCLLCTLCAAGCLDDESQPATLQQYGAQCDDSFACQSGFCVAASDGVSRCSQKCETTSCPRGDRCVETGIGKICSPTAAGQADGGAPTPDTTAPDLEPPKPDLFHPGMPCSSASECAAAYSCMAGLASGDTQMTCKKLCAAYDHASCGAGKACLPDDSGRFACHTGAAVAKDGLCDAAAGKICDKGTLCVAVSSTEARCKATCDYTSIYGCGPGEYCAELKSGKGACLPGTVVGLNKKCDPRKNIYCSYGNVCLNVAKTGYKCYRGCTSSCSGSCKCEKLSNGKGACIYSYCKVKHCVNYSCKCTQYYAATC